jgi:methionyl-tRNA formyltransferase
MLAPLPQKQPRHIVFFGTPDVAVGPLRSLLEAGLHVGLVITGEDKRRGRGSEVSPCPVKVAALELGVPVSHDVADAVAFSKVHDETLGVVVAFGKVFSADVLQTLPMINVHYSLLPRWRGAAPVERAILTGDRETGVSIMQVAEQLDAGDILAQATTTISDTETLLELRSRLESLAEPLLLDVCLRGIRDVRPQVGEPVIARKISAADLHIDFSTSAIVVCRQIRLGGAYAYFRGKRLKIHAGDAIDFSGLGAGEVRFESGDVLVGCNDGAIVLRTVQMEGKATSPASEWCNGARIMKEECFDESK